MILREQQKKEKVTCAAVNRFGVVVVPNKPLSGGVKKEKAWSNRQHTSPAVARAAASWEFGFESRRARATLPHQIFNPGDASSGGYYEPSLGCGD